MAVGFGMAAMAGVGGLERSVAANTGVQRSSDFSASEPAASVWESVLVLGILAG
jgi:hypothetical protein